MSRVINIYLEREKTRHYVGRLQKENKNFVFQYDKSYLKMGHPISLGPDLPLQEEKLSSSSLFPSFADRIPSKKNSAYKEYCQSVGISPSETDPLLLLAKLGQKGPSSFVCALANESFSSRDLKRFRKSLKLSIREFSDLFDVSSATIYRTENNKTSGKNTLKKIAVYYSSPQAALEKIKITGHKINEKKRLFIENFFISPIGPFTVSAKDISSLSPQQAVELIKRLALMECCRYNIPQNSANFSEKTSAPDGGQDGLVEWTQGVFHTNYFPARFNCFQIKTSAMPPQKCKEEIYGKNQKLKPAIQQTIKKRGAYIIVSTQPVSGVHLQAREEAVYEEIKKSSYDPISIKFYDANKIADWLNSFPSLVVWFLKEFFNKQISAWRSWLEWSREERDYQSEFMFHEELKGKCGNIYQTLSKKRKTMHLAGASGTGKTRLALEAFRPAKEPDLSNSALLDLSQLVLYSSAEELRPADLRDLKNSQVILVIDDCSLEQAERFHKIAVQADSQFSLLTIGDEETAQGLQYLIRQKDGSNPIIKLEPDKEITKKILLSAQDIKNKYLPPIYEELTSGFPRMAVLLKSVGPIDLLKEDIPTKKMLWGRKEPDETGEKALKACSLFDTIGIEDNENLRGGYPRGKNEAEYLAKKIGQMDYETFYKKIQFFKKKKIIQQYGRFIKVCPKPLSVWLANELIEETPPESLVKWLTEMKMDSKPQKSYPELSPNEKKKSEKYQKNQLFLQGLLESFCKQLSYMSSYKTAQNLTEKLCGREGLFSRKEILCSEWGSDCLYHLVELNPKVILEALERVFGGKSAEELRAVFDESSPWSHFDSLIRPFIPNGLVLVLKKLAREKELYRRSARLLLSFAVADTASQSQARQAFVNHFQLYLSETSAGPDEKFQMIEEIKNLKPSKRKTLNKQARKKIPASQSEKSSKEALQAISQKDNQKSELIKQKEAAIEALNKALQTRGWTGSLDFMQTKSGQEFESYRPRGYEEEKDYFRKALKQMTRFAVKESDPEIQQKARASIPSHLKPLLKERMYEEVKEAVETVVSVHGSHWPLAVNKLLRFLKYSSTTRQLESRKHAENLLKLFQPGANLNERIRFYITEYPKFFYNEKKRKEYTERFNQLLKDFVNIIEQSGSKQSKKLSSSDLKSKNILIAKSDKNQNSKSLLKQKISFIKEDTFKVLFHGEQKNTYSFAKELAKKLKDPWKFAVDLLALALKWKNDEDFNPIFLSGLIAGLKDLDSNNTKKLLDHIANKKSIADFLLICYDYIPLQDQDIERLISVVDKIHLKSNQLWLLTEGSKCQSVSPKLIEKLILTLMEKGADYLWEAISIHEYYVANSLEKKKALQPALYQLLTNKDLMSKTDKYNKQYISEEYLTAVKDILDSEYKEDFSKSFISQIFSSKKSVFDFPIDDLTIRKVFSKIIQNCPNIFLKEIAQRLDHPNMPFIFKKQSSFSLDLHSAPTPLSDLKEDLLKKWCKTYSKAPVFLAKNIVLFNSQDQLSSFSKFLLDQYGDQEELTEALSFNLGSFSWQGNLSDYFKKVKKALEELEDHKQPNVRVFADREISYLDKQIKACKQREKEFDILNP